MASQLVTIPTNSTHENGELKIVGNLILPGVYDKKSTACELCDFKCSNKYFGCECGALSFPNMEIRYATTDRQIVWVAQVIICDECRVRSDEAYDECTCGSTPISYVLYIPPPQKECAPVSIGVPTKKRPIYPTPPTPIDF